MRNWNTVTAVLPFTSFQPPGYSNASMACVRSEGLYCLHHMHPCSSIHFKHGTLQLTEVMLVRTSCEARSEATRRGGGGHRPT